MTAGRAPPTKRRTGSRPRTCRCAQRMRWYSCVAMNSRLTMLVRDSRAVFATFAPMGPTPTQARSMPTQRIGPMREPMVQYLLFTNDVDGAQQP